MFLTLSAASTASTLEVQAGSFTTEKQVTDLKALREADMQLQTNELSCGAAALATLLNLLGDKQATEAAILKNEKNLEKGKGISLLELKRFAEKRGFKSEGYKMDLPHLAELKIPCLLHLEKDGEKHYVVYRGMRKDRVFLADPTYGNMRLSAQELEKIWAGIALLVEPRWPYRQVVRETEEYVQPELIGVRQMVDIGR
jgi:predicted double-glycine peptidase